MSCISHKFCPVKFHKTLSKSGSLENQDMFHLFYPIICNVIHIVLALIIYVFPLSTIFLIFFSSISGKCHYLRDTSYCPSWCEQVIKNGMTHKKVVKERSKGKIQTRLFDGATGSGSCLSEADMLTRAEALRPLHLVASNHSFASASKDGFLYRTMFPNDAIAKKYKMGETTIKYLIQFGIAPYTKSSMLKDVDGRPFVFKFDETTTSQVKKQYDGYVTFFSKTANKVTTIYAGSLFVGHCMAADLVNHFNKFMKELNLNTNYCLGISMDGPHANKSFYRKISNEIMSQVPTSTKLLLNCLLHIVNNSFGKGMAVARQCDVDIEWVFNDIYFFFTLSAARREDYKNGEEITDITSEYMMKYSSTRWLYIGKIAVRVFE